MRESDRISNSTAAVGKIFCLVNGTVQSCNADACQILGYSFERLTATSLWSLPWQTIGENDSVLLFDAKSLCELETQPFDRKPVVFHQPSGDLIQLSVSTLALYRGDSKEFYGIEIRFVDVDRHLKSDIIPKIESNLGDIQPTSNTFDTANGGRKNITLFESERRLKLATDASGIGMWFWDLVEDVVEWTNLGKAIFGLPLDETPNFEKCFKMIHPEDRSLVKAELNEALVNRTQYSIEYRVVWSDGSVHWTAAKGRGFYNQDGKAVNMIGTVQDISDRKQTEAAFQRSKQDLKQREHELELITEVIPQQIWTAGKDGHIDYINQRWQNYTGLNLKQMQERGWATIVHPEDLPTVRKSWIQSIRTGEIFNLEARLRNADGTYRWFLSKARPLRNERGEITKWYGTNTNINRIKELEEKLRRQTKDLTQANQLKDDFLAIVSHELRTPLNPILGWAQLLAAGRLNAEQTAVGIAVVERNAKLQVQLIDDLLDVSRILRGKLELNKNPLNLEFIIRSAISTVQLTAEAKLIAIETVFEPDVGQILGDAGRLQQIIWNLIANAIKFTPPNGKISIKLKRAGTQALIEIKDTGKGIEPKFIPYVFERFRQEDSAKTREFGGLGLGLAIVKHLTELHGGTVAVSSPGSGKGSTFSVRLPLMNLSISRSTNVNFLDSTAQPNRFENLTILVVDDEADSLDILTLVLQEEGARVISVTSAPAALETFARMTPDFIVSDIGMPDTDGYTLIEEIRKLPQGQNIPAIALTAYAEDIDTQRSLDAGFQKHLAKPIDIPQLIAAITELL